MDEQFLIRFGSNAAVVIAELRQLEAAAIQAERRINATQAASARTAAAAVSPNAARAADAAAAAQNRLGVQTAATGAAMARTGAAVDDATNRVQKHARSLGETALLYGALAAAAAGAASAVSLAATIDTESRRLEAVLALNPAQGRQFVGGLFQTAISTATPIEDILAESDLAASAFSNLTTETERQAAAQTLLHRAGQITTITQRDMATETQNLIAIMKLGNVDVENLGVTLGGITAAGNNSSTAISAILDALKIALPGAKLAGVTIEQLIALTGQFRLATQRDGSAIGSTFSTLFQTITNEKAQNNIADLTNGLVSLRDEAGNLRPVVEIMLEINSLLAAGAIDAGRMQEIFKAFAPPLNPAAAKDIAIIFDLLKQFPAALREVETSGAGAVDGLVDKLNAALGPQFRILIEQIKSGFNDLFGEEIGQGGQTLIDLMRSIGAALGSLDPALLRALGGFLVLGTAMKGIVFVGGSLLSLLGVRGITTAFAGAGAAAAAAGVSTGIFASAVGAAIVVLSRFLPLLAAYAAIDFAQQVGSQQEDLRQKIGGLTTGLDREGLLALRAQIESQKSEGLSDKGDGIQFLPNFGGGLQALLVDPALQDGITEIDRLLAQLEERGEGATVTLEDLGAGFTEAGDASTAINEALAEQAASLEALIEQYTNGADASAGMTEAQRIEAESAVLLEETRVKQAADLTKLAERLREGKITADEFAQGQQIVAQAAQLAAQLVAVQGEELAKYPLFAAAAGEGNDKLVQKVYELIVASGGSIGAIGGLIGQLVNLAATNAAVADNIAANPIVISIVKQIHEGKPSGRDGGLIGLRRARQELVVPGVQNNVDVQAQIDAILGSLDGLLGGLGSGTAAFGNLPSIGSSSAGRAPRAAAAPRQPGLFDLNEFPADKLAKAIALAQRLQSSIPGANKAAKDEVLNIIKDAQFLKQIKGLDDALLRKAIEELTDVEKARLDEEKRKNATNEILRNLQVNTGPLGALISAPTLFGVGGSIPAGVNFDPSSGQFTVNVDFSNFGSLTDKQLQQKIYETIRNAIRDGLRLQGGG